MCGGDESKSKVPFENVELIYNLYKLLAQNFKIEDQKIMCTTIFAASTKKQQQKNNKNKL